MAAVSVGAFDLAAIVADLQRERPGSVAAVETIVHRHTTVPDPDVLVDLYRAAWTTGHSDAATLLSTLKADSEDPAALAELIRAAGQVLGGIIATAGKRLAAAIAAQLTRQFAARREHPDAQWPTVDEDRIDWPPVDLDQYIDWPAVDQDMRDTVAAPAQSELAVETEATRAMVAAAHDTYRAYGAQHIRFLTADDQKVCVKCGENEDHGPVPIDGSGLPNGLPPVHPRCRCTIIPVLDLNDELARIPQVTTT